MSTAKPPASKPTAPTPSPARSAQQQQQHQQQQQQRKTRTRINGLGILKGGAITVVGGIVALGLWVVRRQFDSEPEDETKDLSKLSPPPENFTEDPASIKIFVHLARWKECAPEVYSKLQLVVDNLLFSLKQLRKKGEGDETVQLRYMTQTPEVQAPNTVWVDICKVERDQIFAEELLEQYHRFVLERWHNPLEASDIDYWVGATRRYIDTLARNLRYMTFAGC